MYDDFAEIQERLNGAPGGNDALVTRVTAAAQAIDAGDKQGVQPYLADMLHHQRVCPSAVQRVTQLFAHSLRARLAGDVSGSGNLYQEHPHPQDMLAAFQLLLHGTPFIRYGYTSANMALLDALVHEPRLHIIDIGIGSGTQWHQFLGAFATRSTTVPHVRLTGIDLPAPGPAPAQRLQEVAEDLRRRAAALGVPFTCDMLAVPVEVLDVDAIAIHADEALAINAAFALHHVPAGDGVKQPARSRDAVLRRLRHLHPRILTLIEPDAEHNALPFIPRVREALAHYLTVFDALDAYLPPERPERAIIESAFFGREILNIIAGEGVQRVERHERHTSWVRRLETLAFASIDLGSLVPRIAGALHLVAPFDIRRGQRELSLTWKGLPLVAVSAWTPAPYSSRSALAPAA